MPPKTRFTYRHQYDDTADAIERAATDITCLDESKTLQHFTPDADLNVIMKRYGMTDGSIPPQAADPSYYGDFRGAPDFRAALDRSRDALEKFSMLPAKIRNKFNNDPTELFEWVSDENNHEEAVQLGLLSKAPASDKAALIPATSTAPLPNTATTTAASVPTVQPS
jgi:hypothetical protein